MNRKAGRVVILNGVSSAGKSTLAEAFANERAEHGEFWLVMGIDDFLAKVQLPWFKGGDHDGVFSADGIRFEPAGDADGSILPRVGAVGRQLLAAYRRSVAACARVGFDVIVDEVAFDQVAVADWDDALTGLRVTWVAVHCRADVAAERERARGDRYQGLALGLSRVVHEHARYDLELDTTDSSVEVILAALTHLVCP